MTPITVGLAGTRGYGEQHLKRLVRLIDDGRVALVGVADPAGAGRLVPEGVPVHDSVTDLLAATVPEVMIISTPINTHAPLAEESMRAGSHVYLEKPPVESLASFTRLVSVSRELGRTVQVGFQAAGSQVLPQMHRVMESGDLGRIGVITATGLWSRDRAYYARSPWAGHRRIGDVVIADGVVTNPLAHAVAAALHVAGAERVEDIRSVSTELHRAHDNECDDTSWVGIDSVGIPVTAGLTVSSGVNEPPYVAVHGERGSLTFDYRSDVLTSIIDGHTTTETYSRVDTFENLLDHLSDGVPLLSPLTRTGGFMCVLQAIQEAPAPKAIDPAYVTWSGDGPDGIPTVADIGRLVADATCQANASPGLGFAAAGAPWASAEDVTTWRPTA